MIEQRASVLVNDALLPVFDWYTLEAGPGPRWTRIIFACRRKGLKLTSAMCTHARDLYYFFGGGSAGTLPLQSWRSLSYDRGLDHGDALCEHNTDCVAMATVEWRYMR